MDKSQKRGKKAPQRSRAKSPSAADEGTRIGRRNVVLFALALATIILGFALLAAGSTSLSVILLVLGYLVLVPSAILAGTREKHPSAGSSTS